MATVTSRQLDAARAALFAMDPSATAAVAQQRAVVQSFHTELTCLQVAAAVSTNPKGRGSSVMWTMAIIVAAVAIAVSVASVASSQPPVSHKTTFSSSSIAATTAAITSSSTPALPVEIPTDPPVIISSDGSFVVEFRNQCQFPVALYFLRAEVACACVRIEKLVGGNFVTVVSR
jgi:hypothetical protein